MANKLYKEESIQAIANAIRTQNRSSDTYTVAEMASAIEDLPWKSDGYEAERLQTGTILAGTFQIVPLINPLYNLGVANRSADTGAMVQLATREENVKSFQWNITPTVNGNGYFEIGNTKSFCYLSVENAGATAESNIIQESYSGADIQQWTIVEYSKGVYFIINKTSGLAIGLPSEVPTVGMQLKLYQPTDANVLKFYLVKQAVLPNSTYRFAPINKIQSSLEVINGLKTDGANVHLWENNEAPCQKWTLALQDDYSYKITNYNSNKTLEVEHSIPLEGNVQQMCDRHLAAQRWNIIPNKNGTYTFFSKHGKPQAVNLIDSDTANGTNINTYSYHGGIAQQWLAIGNADIPHAVYTIGCYTDRLMLVEVKGDQATAEDGNVQVWEANNALLQRWEFIFDSTDGTYIIKNHYSSMLLSASNAGTTAGTNVVQASPSGGTVAGNHQKWLAVKLGDGSFVFLNKAATMALDLSTGGTPYMGQNIQIYSYILGAPQRWWLTKISDAQ